MRPAVNVVVAILKTENGKKPCIVFCDEVILPLIKVDLCLHNNAVNLIDITQNL